MEIDDDNTNENNYEESINKELKIVLSTTKIIKTKMKKIIEDLYNITKYKNNIIDIKFDLLAIHNILYHNNINFEKIFDNKNRSLNNIKKLIFNIKKVEHKIKFIININKKILKDKSCINNYIKPEKFLKISNKLFISYRAIYYPKKESKKYYKIFTKNQIYASKYEANKRKVNKNIFQIYYYNVGKNIMDNPGNLFKESIIEKEKIIINDKNCLLNNMNDIKYIEYKNNLKKFKNN